MSAMVRDRGKNVNAFGWAIAHVQPLPPSLPEYTLLKVTAVRDPRTWGPEKTLTVVNAEGTQWSISEHCFQPRLLYSFDDGCTTYPEKHRRVQRYIFRELCKAEAELEKLQATVAGYRWILQRNGTDPDLRRKEIERLQRALHKPYGYKKPGSRLDYHRDQKRKAQAELTRIINGGEIKISLPGDEYDDSEDEIPY